jgi:hypothetical protein
MCVALAPRIRRGGDANMERDRRYGSWGDDRGRYGREERDDDFGPGIAIDDEWRNRGGAIGNRDEDWRGRGYADYRRDPMRFDRDAHGGAFDPHDYGSHPYDYGHPASEGRFDRDRWSEHEREHPGLWHRMREHLRGAFGRDRGPFYGRGPKGYKRSDERIREDVCETISYQGWIDASDVEVRVTAGEVTLTGTIPDRWQKRRLEAMIEGVPGVEDVRNELRVHHRDEASTDRDALRARTARS